MSNPSNYRPCLTVAGEQSGADLTSTAPLAPFEHHLRSGASAGDQAAAGARPVSAAAASLSRRLRGSASAPIAMPDLPEANAMAPTLPGLGTTPPIGPVTCDLPDGRTVSVDEARIWMLRFWSRGARRAAHEQCLAHVTENGVGTLRSLFGADGPLRSQYLALLAEHAAPQLRAPRIFTAAEVELVVRIAQAVMTWEFDRLLYLDDQELF